MSRSPRVGAQPMERNYEAPAVRFALDILRRHPQISYEHAVSAAEYAGVPRLPRDVFFHAARRLGIPRDRDDSDQGAAPGDPGRPGATNGPSAALLLQLEALRQQAREDARIRDALLRMREVVRAVLAADAGAATPPVAGDG